MIILAKRPSARQITAVNIWLHGGRKSKAAALRKAGYGESIARQPHKVFKSAAVIRELEIRGYNAWGVREEPEAVSFLAEAEAASKPKTIPALTIEALQTLKEKLEAVDGTPLRFLQPTPETLPSIPSTPVVRYAPHVRTGDPFSSM